jgi:hypothetical protein
MGTSHTEKSAGSSRSSEVLQPDPADDSAHRKAQEIHVGVGTKSMADLLVQTLR